MASFAKKVLTIRKQCGLNQGQFARAIGVSQGTVSRWEAGKQDCNVEAAIKLSEFSGKSFNYWLLEDSYNIRLAYAEIRYILRAGEWVDYDLVSDIDNLFIEMPLINANIPDYIIGYYLDSDNMNNIFSKGTVIFAINPSKIWKPKSGQHVIVERRDINDLYELALWELRVNNSGDFEFLPNSTLSHFQDPEPGIPILEEGISNVEIVGLVIGSFHTHTLDLLS